MLPRPFGTALPVLFLVVVLTGCGNTVVGPPDGTPTFAADIRPIFASRCGACHTSQTTNGVNLSTHANVRASVGTQYGEAVIRPGDAANSPLVDIIEPSPRFGSRMPLNGTPLSTGDISTIRAWIDAGALND